MWVNRVAASDNRDGVTLAVRLSPRRDGQGLVKASFPHNSPWRTLVIAREPGRLIESDLVLNLSSPCALADTSWIKPGIASWDWWSQVTRPSTATYREYIQFSSDVGWAYALLDEGWSRRNDIMQTSAAVDMDELLAFAKARNVRLWLWLHWSNVDRNDAYKEAFALYEKWGIAGVKIDFMNRDDQERVNWYEKIVKAAAEHHLMVNFHGAFKPTGMNRTYPNQGTRCAELALFVCLESPVINACDHPSHYRDEPGLDFLKIVPTVWDETRVIDAVVGEHLVIVRRRGNRWFLGALTDRHARDISVKLSFLDGGPHTLKLWRNAPDSDEVGAHLATEQRAVKATDEVTLHLAPAGGAVAIFEPTPPADVD